MNKKELAILLSQLKTFRKQDIGLEQYQTTSEIAANILWFGFMNKDIKNKIIADFGCGNGVLGIGALILGAKKVYFIDIDKNAIEISKNNLKFIEERLRKRFKANFVNKDIKDIKNKFEVIIQNPPFGVKKVHQDKVF